MKTKRAQNALLVDEALSGRKRRCPKHPKYTAYHAPKTLCVSCWAHYIDKLQVCNSLELAAEDYDMTRGRRIKC